MAHLLERLARLENAQGKDGEKREARRYSKLLTPVVCSGGTIPAKEERGSAKIGKGKGTERIGKGGERTKSKDGKTGEVEGG